jgi:hypothetical protein
MKRIKLARMDCEKVSGEIGDFVIEKVRCTAVEPWSGDRCRAAAFWQVAPQGSAAVSAFR